MAESDKPEEREPIEIDLYGIRVPLKPKPTDEIDPDSWAEVWARVHASLRGIVTNSVGLLNDTLKGARSLVRGVGALPDAVQHRVRSAHARADRAEATTRELVVADPEVVRKGLEHLISRKRVQGYRVHVESRDGKLIVCFLPPMPDDQLARVVEEAGAALPPTAAPESE